MNTQEKINDTDRSEKTPQGKRLSLMEFAEVFLSLPESAKREVLGYAKCLYASANGNSLRDGA